MRLLWLADVLHTAGLTVHEVNGWKTRGADSFGPVRGITCHHTAGSRNSTDEGEIRVLLNGSTSAPPPIAQLYLSRSGAWWTVASGTCYHNKIGWAGPNKGYGNDALIGIEAQHSGGDEPWTDVQYRSYVRGVAALVRKLDVPVDRVAGHKEHQPGAKTDPTFDMDDFRAAVRAVLDGKDDMDITTKFTDGAAKGLTFQQVVNLLLNRTNADVNEERFLARRERAAILTAVKEVLTEVTDDPGVPLTVDDQSAELIAGKVATRVAGPVADELAGRLQS